MIQLTGLGVISLFLSVFPGCCRESVETGSVVKKKLHPVLEGDWWLIGASPELEHLLPETAREGPDVSGVSKLVAQAIEHGIDKDYFYLFRTENYYAAVTHVYRSDDPLDFGKFSRKKRTAFPPMTRRISASR